MRRGPFTARQDGDYYNCRFAYCPELIAFIKDAAPRRARWWDPSGPYWTIHSNYLDGVLEQARYMGFSVRVESSTGHTDEDENDPPPGATPGGDVTADFVHLLSYDALHAAYKRMSIEVHPDRPGGGDPESMKKLNSIWDSLKKKFGK
jgi:hypothetical protein